eukprot:TRINITY_DN8638_c0_g1_i1.p1 TRINITY_DN8638_c0_g1~~TRINITY_DN8638_c0_g1_i1.p1  ORF type:complete len:142 (+),score=29.35 TRINITY_DN8638_c0_g1_i1:43-468(+)
MSVWVLSAWLIALVLDGFFLFQAIFRLIMVADLKADYVNPVEFAQKLNVLWLPEVVGVGVNTALSLLFGTWWVFVLHVPCAAYLGFVYSRKQHIINPTRILQGNSVNTQQTSALIRLGFYLVFFFLYLYLVIISAISLATD